MIAPAAYEVEREALGPELAAAFVPLEADEAALAFAAAAEAAPHGRLALGARALLRRVLTDFDANGLLGLHPMHVLSTAQWRRLLALPSGARLERVLDVGAGDGQVSESLRPLADALVTTELSRAMAWRLRRRGLPCHRLDLTDAPLPGEAPFSLIAAQNLLDRCDRPRTLLARLCALLAPEGRLAVALALPYDPHVDLGATTAAPTEPLPIDGPRFEAQAERAYSRLFAPAGLEITAFSRAPYLCRGSAAEPLHALDDALFVLRRAP